MKVPDFNAPLEEVEFLSWVKTTLLGLLETDESHDSAIASLREKLGMSAGSETRTNVQVEQNRVDIIELWDRAGVPRGGWRGSVLIRDVEGELQWTSPVGSSVPMYWVYLVPGDPSYEIAQNGSQITQEEVKAILPEPLFEDDGRSMDWPISWGDELEDLTSNALASNNMPISISVYLYPTEAGQDFRIAVPIALKGAPWSIVHVYNDGGFAADVTMHFHHSAPFYTGTGVPVPAVRSLAPDEGLVWKVDEAHEDGVATVTPFTAGSVSTDKYHWANVAAVRMSKEFTAFGDDLVPVVSLPITHERLDSPRIGKVRAVVSPAPSTGGVTVDVKLNGASILSTPLVVPAGSTAAEVVPDVTNYTHFRYGSAVRWGPDVGLTFEVVSNASSTPVTSLTGQVFYG